MNINYLDENLKGSYTAGFKAPSDIAAICQKMGYNRIEMPYIKHYKNKLLYKAETLIKFIIFWNKLLITLPNDSILIYQHPTLGKKIAAKYLSKLNKRKNRKVICLIHDLEFLRGTVEGVNYISEKYKAQELKLLNSMDYIICHNDRMRKLLIEKGIEDNKLVSLKIFDYLTDCPINRSTYNKETICIAGNLAPGKAGYLYSLFSDSANCNLTANLYGSNFDNQGNANMTYKGSFTPDEVPGVLEGSFGLVWDGNTATTCGGNTGEYLRFNNPHKTSLYLASGIPVIVWSSAAIADFVSDNNVGIKVDSLYDIDKKLSELSDDDYLKMKENAISVSSKLREGYFFTDALKTVLRRIENKTK